MAKLKHKHYGRSLQDRKLIHTCEINMAMEETWEALKDELERKGFGTFASKHEIKGVLDEEFDEVLDAIKMHGDTNHQHLAEELKDLAVGAIFGLACIRAGTLDW